MITTRVELAQYALRRLGQGAVRINVTEDQIQERIQDALDFLQQYSIDFTADDYFVYEFTAADVARFENNNPRDKHIEIPDDVVSVRKILPVGSIHGNFNQTGFLGIGVEESVNVGSSHFHNQDMHRVGPFSDMEIVRQYQQMFRSRFSNEEPRYRFHLFMGRLMLDSTWSRKMREDDKIVMDVNRVVDVDTYHKSLNDMDLKELVTEMIRQQWGTNLMKFSEVPLRGGARLNGDRMYDLASQNIERIQERIKNKQPPLGIYMG